MLPPMVAWAFTSLSPTLAAHGPTGASSRAHAASGAAAPTVMRPFDREIPSISARPSHTARSTATWPRVC